MPLLPLTLLQHAMTQAASSWTKYLQVLVRLKKRLGGKKCCLSLIKLLQAFSSRCASLRTTHKKLPPFG